MYGILFRAEAHQGKYQALFEFLKWNGQVARDHEPGTLRFELYPDPADDNAFIVYEAYRDAAAFEAHQQGAPYQRWSAGLREELTSNVTVLLRTESAWSPEDRNET